MNNFGKQTMTVEEVSTYLQFHEQTIYRWLREGKIKARRVGGQWRFTEEDVQNILRVWEKETNTSNEREGQ